MILTDWIVLVALLVCLVAWWRRTMRNRTQVLAISASVALIAGLTGLTMDRWQDGFGALLALLFLAVVLVQKIRDKAPRNGKPWISGPLFTLLFLGAFLMIWWFPVNDLPPPGGEYPVGVRDFELSDTSRMGLIAADPGEPRRLLVRVWYPADNVDGIKPRPYFTQAEADSTALALGSLVNIPFFFKYARLADTHSYPEAPLRSGATGLPTVFYSHGYTSFLSQNTALMEELASHGYIVYSIQHTYDSAATVFPNGDVVETDPGLLDEMLASVVPTEAMTLAFTARDLTVRHAATLRNYDEAIARNDRITVRSTPIWLEDRLFVMDALGRGEAPESVADVVAASRLDHTGQAGMSFGGSTTGALCMVDDRCAAGVNLDGGQFEFSSFNAEMPVPFLMLYSDYTTMVKYFPGAEDPVLRGYNNFFYEPHETVGLRDDIYRFKVRHVQHLGYSDFTHFARGPVRAMFFGTIDPEHMLPIQNDFVRGFFDTHLRGMESDFPAAQIEAHQDWVSQEDLSEIRDWWLTSRPHAARP